MCLASLIKSSLCNQESCCLFKFCQKLTIIFLKIKTELKILKGQSVFIKGAIITAIGVKWSGEQVKCKPYYLNKENWGTYIPVSGNSALIICSFQVFYAVLFWLVFFLAKFRY